MRFEINHHHYHPELHLVLERLEEIMSALDNLNTAEANLETVATAILADIKSLSDQLAAANTANDPAIQEVADKLNAVSASLQAVVPAATPPAPPAA